MKQSLFDEENKDLLEEVKTLFGLTDEEISLKYNEIDSIENIKSRLEFYKQYHLNRDIKHFIETVCDTKYTEDFEIFINNITNNSTSANLLENKQYIIDYLAHYMIYNPYKRIVYFGKDYKKIVNGVYEILDKYNQFIGYKNKLKTSVELDNYTKLNTTTFPSGISNLKGRTCSMIVIDDVETYKVKDIQLVNKFIPTMALRTMNSKLVLLTGKETSNFKEFL